MTVYCGERSATLASCSARKILNDSSDTPRFFLACGLASGRTSFASSRTAMLNRLCHL